MKKIILNCLPPFSINRPSPALSILKTWLTKHGYESSVIYWNLHFHNLQNDFVWNDPTVLETSNSLSLYTNYLVCRSGDEKLYISFKNLLKGYSTRFISENAAFYDKHMQEYAEKVDNLIGSVLFHINIEETLLWGFSIKMDCWITASIIARKIKKKNPNVLILIGGINTKQCAISYLENFPEFDIAMWGEGEEHLVQLVETINSGKNKYSDVGNIAYRDNDRIMVSEAVHMKFSNMSEEGIYPDFDDYFKQKKMLKINCKTTIPIEGSRGCHWNKCKFCYLNEDYKYRVKSIDKICDEINYMINKYEIFIFDFLDNDFIGVNTKISNNLLDRLIDIKKKEPRFRIEIAEVITNGLKESIIKKIFAAGIVFVQIGYESPSHNLLKKINKKNTFASNLLYVKFTTSYGVPLYNVNVLTSMPDEKEEDILEAIDNLRFLRFFLHPIKFKHILVPVQVNSTSRYFPLIKDEIINWIPSTLAYEYFSKWIKVENHWDIFTFIKRSYNYQWDTFKRVEKFYLDSKYSYSLSKTEEAITFSEYNKSKKINEIIIKRNSLDEIILKRLNDSVTSLDKLIFFIQNEYGYQYSKENILNVIEYHSTNGLIYHSPDYSEMVSIINMNT